jgi:hypothetical protein
MGNRDIVLRLLEYGMDVNFAKSGDPPLLLGLWLGILTLLTPC